MRGSCLEVITTNVMVDKAIDDCGSDEGHDGNIDGEKTIIMMVMMVLMALMMMMSILEHNRRLPHPT